MPEAAADIILRKFFLEAHTLRWSRLAPDPTTTFGHMVVHDFPHVVARQIFWSQFVMVLFLSILHLLIQLLILDPWHSLLDYAAIMMVIISRVSSTSDLSDHLVFSDGSQALHLLLLLLILVACGEAG